MGKVSMAVYEIHQDMRTGFAIIPEFWWPDLHITSIRFHLDKVRQYQCSEQGN